MSKPSDLWLRNRDQFWMNTVRGTQHKLSKDKAEARRMLARLLSEDAPPPDRRKMSARKVCDAFLVRTRKDKSPEGHAVQVRHLKAFCDALGHRDAAALKVHEVEEWLDGRGGWADSTKA